MRGRYLGLSILLIVLVPGCAKRPVLYPNAHLQSVGVAASKAEIEECMALADAADLGNNAVLEAGTKTAGGAAVGGATGAVAGAISGRPGFGAAIGASTGAVSGFFSWLFGAAEPEPIYKQYVDRCLRDRGFDTIGWK
jgi:hypothetical protein